MYKLGCFSPSVTDNRDWLLAALKTDSSPDILKYQWMRQAFPPELIPELGQWDFPRPPIHPNHSRNTESYCTRSCH